MANETDRPKEPVKIRFKTLKNGNKSIYFDIYANGVRKYEFLKLYLYPETTTASKQHNRMTMQAVNVLKSKRVVDLTNQRCGITANDIANKITLGEFFASYIERRRKTRPKGLRLFTNLLRHLNGWRMAGVKLSQLDKPFCEKVICKLRAQEWTDTTKHNNVTFFTMVLNEAVRAGLMTVNPMRLIPPTDKIKMPESNREFLTLEELQLIINYQPPKRCRVARLVKRAFLFACFSGLRVSDICALCWRDIQTAENGGLPFVRMTMQKTKRTVNVPLCDDAVMWLPDRPDFHGWTLANPQPLAVHQAEATTDKPPLIQDAHPDHSNGWRYHSTTPRQRANTEEADREPTRHASDRGGATAHRGRKSGAERELTPFVGFLSVG